MPRRVGGRVQGEGPLCDATTELEWEGAIRAASYLAECPFNAIWEPTQPVTELCRQLAPGEQFAYNHYHGKGDILTGFHPVDDFTECEDDD